MKVFSVPGAAWTAAIAFVSLWLTQYFGAEPWVPMVVAALGGVLKFLEMWMEPKPEPPPPGVMADPSYQPVEKPNPVTRFLVG